MELAHGKVYLYQKILMSFIMYPSRNPIPRSFPPLIKWSQKNNEKSRLKNTEKVFKTKNEITNGTSNLGFLLMSPKYRWNYLFKTDLSNVLTSSHLFPTQSSIRILIFLITGHPL